MDGVVMIGRKEAINDAAGLNQVPDGDFDDCAPLVEAAPVSVQGTTRSERVPAALQGPPSLIGLAGNVQSPRGVNASLGDDLRVR